MSARTYRLHYGVDYNTGVASCGAGHGLTIAMPARDVMEVDCRRCLADPEIAYAINSERDRREWVKGWKHEAEVVPIESVREGGKSE